MGIEEMVRAVVQESGRSNYWISTRARVPLTAINEFVRGERSLDTRTMDRIMKTLRMVCEVKPRPKVG